MARLVGVDLPRDKRIEIALTYIFGVGRTRCLQDPFRGGPEPGPGLCAGGDPPPWWATGAVRCSVWSR